MPVSDGWPVREHWIDERGNRCPAPVIALARAARASTAGATLVVLADDPAAEFDIPAWCRMTGNTFLASMAQEHGAAYAVRLSEN